MGMPTITVPNIRQLRIQRGATQTEVAQQVGVKQPLISALESALRPEGLVWSIAEFLEAPDNQLPPQL